jgi:hypothetical protein
MIGHHDLEVADATAYLGDIFGVTFEQRRKIEAVLIADSIHGPVAFSMALKKAFAPPCFSKLRIASSNGF